MEQFKPAGEQKIQEYVDRIHNGESKDSIVEGLPDSFKTAIDKKISETTNQAHVQKQIEDVRKKLGITQSVPQAEFIQEAPIKYIDVLIDDEYMQKNLMPNGRLRMQGGQANWNGVVDLMRYTISEKLSPQYRQIAQDKIEKFNAGQEKTYHHESHHIHNREHGLTPHVVAENMREFLAFRVLDELSAFMSGELYNQELTPQHVLSALQKAKQDIQNSYYGEPFTNDAQWYMSQHGNESEVLSRQINQEKYHKIMKHYFTIKGQDIFSIMQGSNLMSEFTDIVNELILQLDSILEDIRPNR